MPRLNKETEYQRLSKELGRVDAERRIILNQMKKTPEMVAKYLKESLTKFILTKSWFSRTNAKGESAYYKLVGFKFTQGDKVIVTNDKHKNLIAVDLEWDYYDYNAVNKQKAMENVFISVFNDIDKQVLNGRKEASSFDEKKLLKAQLTEKKERLKAELKELEEAIKVI